MWFVLLGLLLIALKWIEFDPVSAWSWWWVLSPFAAAVLWWAWADWSGYTKRREVDKIDERKKERRRKSMEALGMEERRRR